MDKKVYRSKNRKLYGVCGGIAEYFSIDPTLIRLVFVCLAFTSIGVLAYIVALIMIPESPY